MLVKNVVGKDQDWQYKWAKNQTYIALGQLMMTCALMNIDACPMEGFMPSKYDEILGLTDKGLTAMVVCPVGEASYAKNKSVRPTEEVTVLWLAFKRFEAGIFVPTAFSQSRTEMEMVVMVVFCWSKMTKYCKF